MALVLSLVISYREFISTRPVSTTSLTLSDDSLTLLMYSFTLVILSPRVAALCEPPSVSLA